MKLPIHSSTPIRQRQPASATRQARRQQALSDDHSEVEPPLPIPNRNVKRFCADDSGLLARESRTSSDTPPFRKNPYAVRVFLSKTRGRDAASGQQVWPAGLAKGFDVVLECTIRWKRLFFKNQQPISVGIWEKVARSLVRRPGCCAGRGRQKYP